MTMYKVEICGVNTSKLPLLSTKEKEELIIKVKNGDKAARAGRKHFYMQEKPHYSYWKMTY
mgnify:CR=1 FL=1